MASAPRRGGFTLLELLTAIVLIGVLASIAGPSLRDHVLRARLDGVLRELTADLYHARAHAARTGARVRVRFAPRRDGCVPGYAVEEAATGRPLAGVDLRVGAPGVCLTVAGSPTVTIDARGMPVGAARRVHVRTGTLRDSLTLSLVGRVYR